MNKKNKITIFLSSTALVMLALNPVAGWSDESSAKLYRLATGDKVRITVYGHEDLSGEFEVDGSGNISLPLVQDVPAEDLTLKELETSVTNFLKPDYLINPRVSAEIMNYRPIYIIGEVNDPGSYTYTSGMTVINAVAVAGGFTYRAKKSKLSIVRGDEDEREEIRVDADTLVLPGDVIEVPERFF